MFDARLVGFEVVDFVPNTRGLDFGNVFVEEVFCGQVEGHAFLHKLTVSLRDLHVGVEFRSIIQDLVAVGLRDRGRDVAPAEVCLAEAFDSQLDYSSHQGLSLSANHLAVLRVDVSHGRRGLLVAVRVADHGVSVNDSKEVRTLAP